MEKNEKRFLIIGIIIAIILFLILVVFGIIFYLGIINNNKREEEINRKGKETATVPSDKNLVEDRDENVIKNNGNIKKNEEKDPVIFNLGRDYKTRNLHLFSERIGLQFVTSI